MVEITARRGGNTWFGIAWSGSDFVATAVGATEASAFAAVRHCLPAGVRARLHAGPSAFVDGAVRLLASLEAGDEANKRYTLSRLHLSAPLFRIHSAAARIPIGYVSTYGAVALAAGSEARAVGRAMATNPLYPIVPCHRVVGSDLSLVGYGGRQDDAALAAKLARLEAEARGAADAKEIDVGTGSLELYPVEWVVAATREEDERMRRRREADAARARDDTLQEQLF